MNTTPVYKTGARALLLVVAMLVAPSACNSGGSRPASESAGTGAETPSARGGEGALEADSAEAPEAAAESAVVVETAKAATHWLVAGTSTGAAATATIGRALNPFVPLPEAVKARFLSLRSDPDPESLVRNAHYYVSNEHSHWIWHDQLKDLGGVMVGVGTDQLYLFAGWAKTSILVPLDFDRAIPRLHRVYGLLFERAATPEEFLALWAEERRPEVNEWIKERFTDAKEQRTILRAFRQGGDEVDRRLRLVVNKYTARDIPTFVTDQAQYDFVKMLWANERVFPICGDLTGDESMVDVAKAATESGLAVDVLYVSNSEIYFDFEAAYRRNIIVQPTSEKSLFLRTRQAEYLGFAAENDYHYNIEPLENFAKWMAWGRFKKIGRIYDKRRESGVEGLSIIDKDPTGPGRRRPELAPFPEWWTAPAWWVPAE